MVSQLPFQLLFGRLSIIQDFFLVFRNNSKKPFGSKEALWKLSLIHKAAPVNAIFSSGRQAVKLFSDGIVCNDVSFPTVHSQGEIFPVRDKVVSILTTPLSLSLSLSLSSSSSSSSSAVYTPALSAWEQRWPLWRNGSSLLSTLLCSYLPYLLRWINLSADSGRSQQRKKADCDLIGGGVHVGSGEPTRVLL